MDSSRASHLLLAYCNSLQGFHSHHWGCENSALCLIHSHRKGCRRHSSQSRLPWFAATSVRVTAKMRADVQLHLPASFHSPKSPAKNESGEVEYTFLSPVFFVFFCLVMFCRMGEWYCVAMLTHELLTAAASPGPSHYRLTKEKEPASHSANSNTTSTPPSQLPEIQKRLTHTNTHSLNLQTTCMLACIYWLAWVCIGI